MSLQSSLEGSKEIKSFSVYITCTDSKKSTACISEVENGLKFYGLNLLYIEKKIFSGFMCWTSMSNLA